MEAARGVSEPETRSRAIAVIGAFAGAVVLGIVLLIAFEPDVQQAGAVELVAREDDARSFFVADFVFILLYAVLSPLAIWRFGATIEGGPPRWISAAVVILPLAGLVDAIENVLIWSAAGSPSPDTVDAAHSLAIPKVVLFVAGSACAVGALVKAVRALR